MLIARNWKSVVSPTLFERHVKCLMNKLTSIKRFHNENGLAIYFFGKKRSKFIEYWKLIKPNDSSLFELLEML